MKKIFFIVIILSLTSFIMKAQNVKTEQFKVFGNCEMCKVTIENALDVRGIKSAEWNIVSHILTVVYNQKKVSIEQIHKYVAKAGYDTELEKGNDEAYSKLPKCCKYERRK